MMDNGKRIGNIVLIILLFIIIVGLLGFIVYDKVLATNPSTGGLLNSNNRDVESLEVIDPLVIGLLDKVSDGMNCHGYDKIYIQDKEVNSNSFSNTDIYNLALNNLYKKLLIVQNQQIVGYNQFTEADLEAEIENIVGKEYKFTHKTYQSCPQWNYDALTKTYVINPEVGCGCTSGPYHDILKTVKAEKIGNRIEIFQRIVFVDSATGKGYSDFAKTREIADLSFTSDNLGGDPIYVIDEDNMSNYSKGALYKIVFEEKNNNYIFVSAGLAD